MDSDNHTEVMIMTLNYLITGMISLPEGARLTDYLSERKQFIAVTEATVCTKEGSEVLKTEFLNVSRDYIEIMLPTAMMNRRKG